MRSGVMTPHNWLTARTYRSIVNLPKTKSVISDPSSPDKKLVLFRVPEFGQFMRCCSPFDVGYGLKDRI